tara:strand:- start:778 stop:1878 length:1101 start_codon:yes stop_codon:yes gene_type:complete
MNKKDLLIVLNIFGHHSNEDHQINSYKQTLYGIFKQIENATEHTFRVVISACLVSDRCIEELKREFGDSIHIFRFVERYTCQVTSNCTILKAIKHFNEEYEGYLYFSSGIYFAEDSEQVTNITIASEQNIKTQITTRVGNPFIFANLIKKLKTKKYGIIQLQVDQDHGYHFLGHGPTDWAKNINFQNDYVIPPGNHANFHIAAIHRSLKDYYRKPISDIHGLCGMESTLSYCCAALQKQYILMGDSIVIHKQKFDSDYSVSGRMLNTSNVPIIFFQGRNPCSNLLWRRLKSEIANDEQALRTGMGYYPGMAANNVPDWNGTILVHKKEKYDHEYLSTDPEMKEAVKRLFFSNTEDIHYDYLYCKIY